MANDPTTARFGPRTPKYRRVIRLRSSFISTRCRGDKEQSPEPRARDSRDNRVQIESQTLRVGRDVAYG